jgi:hypothetical protein
VTILYDTWPLWLVALALFLLRLLHGPCWEIPLMLGLAACTSCTAGAAVIRSMLADFEAAEAEIERLRKGERP